MVRSIASLVVLDPQQGTATKVYRPPLVVRLIYWLAFQARFPYNSNRQALVAGQFRREIASKLTTFRFGKDLVAPVIAINRVQGEFNFVTEYVPGGVAENDEAAKSFLTQVSETFAAAGLSVWQVNPRNPHAHTNLIRTPAGAFKIIDLESAIVTPFLERDSGCPRSRVATFPYLMTSTSHVYGITSLATSKHWRQASGPTGSPSSGTLLTTPSRRLAPGGMPSLGSGAILSAAHINTAELEGLPATPGRCVSRGGQRR